MSSRPPRHCPASRSDFHCTASVGLRVLPAAPPGSRNVTIRTTATACQTRGSRIPGRSIIHSNRLPRSSRACRRNLFGSGFAGTSGSPVVPNRLDIRLRAFLDAGSAKVKAFIQHFKTVRCWLPTLSRLVVGPGSEHPGRRCLEVALSLDCGEGSLAVWHNGSPYFSVATRR